MNETIVAIIIALVIGVLIGWASFLVPDIIDYIKRKLIRRQERYLS
jgi:uncharacterized membrane protein YczE